MRTHPVDKLLEQHCYKPAAGLLQLVHFYVCTEMYLNTNRNHSQQKPLWRREFADNDVIEELKISSENLNTRKSSYKLISWSRII